MYRGDWRGAAVAVKLVSQAAPLDGALIAEFRRWARDVCRDSIVNYRGADCHSSAGSRKLSAGLCMPMVLRA